MVKYGELEVPILFSETHYGQDWEKVKILCIKRPLTEASFEFHDEVGKYFSFHEFYEPNFKLPFIFLSTLSTPYMYLCTTAI